MACRPPPGRSPFFTFIDDAKLTPYAAGMGKISSSEPSVKPDASASSAASESIRSEGRPGRVVSMGRALLAGAIAISCYLVYGAMKESGVAGCGEGAGCHNVLASKWSKISGVPVGILGIGLYLSLLGSSAVARAGKWRSFLSLCIIGGALWFTGIQAFALKTFCPWCCSAHLLATAGTLMIWLTRRAAGSPSLLPAMAAAAALGSMALIQIKAPEPKTSASAGKSIQTVIKATPKGREFVEVHGKFRFSTAGTASLGDAALAEFVAVGLFDFSCKHCRDTLKLLKPIVDSFAGRLAILKLPGYFDDNGREIHRMMLSLYKGDPALYSEVSEQLYAEILTARAPAVKQQLEGRMGKVKLAQMLAAHGPWAEERLQQTKEISNQNKAITKSGRLPQLIAGKSVEAGSNDSPNHYYQVFADNFGLKLGNGALLACDPPAIDFGEVIVMGESLATVTLSNRGEGLITFGAMQRPKGVILLDAPEKLAPGESRVMTVRLQVPQMPTGRSDTFLMIRSNALDPEIKVPLLAAVRNPFKVEPRALDFGNVAPGSSSPVSTITLAVDAPVKIGHATASLPDFMVTGTEEVEDGTKFRISLVAVPKVDSGFRSGYLNIPIEPDTAQTGASSWPKQLRIPLRLRAFSPPAASGATPPATPRQ